MTEPQHTHLDGIADYTAALDALCSLAQHTLYFFEFDCQGLGFNSEARQQALRRFLFANPANRLLMLVCDAHYLSTQCPRMTALLRQFDSRMSIHQPSKPNCTTPFGVADRTHCIRRFHFDDHRGLMAKSDPEQAHMLEAIFMEMWQTSKPAIPITILGL